MAGTNGNGQGVYVGRFDKFGRFFRIGQQLFHVQLAFSANAVFFTGHACFQAAQAAQLAFNRHTTGVGHFDGTTGNVNVVVVIGGCFAVFAQ